MSRFLVKTAIEETWPAKAEPILFLGEWCCLYDRARLWSSRDAIVVPYHWDDREKLHQDYLFLQKTYEGCLTLLSEKLNEIHGVGHSTRYWRILIGPWLGVFIQILFDRWFMLKTAINDYDVSGVRSLTHPDGVGIPNDFDNFRALPSSDDWNELIYNQIIDWMALSDSPIIVDKAKSRDVDWDTYSQVQPSNVFRRTLKNFVNKASFVFSNDDDYFFMLSCMKKELELRLQIRLGQLPKIWSFVELPKTNACLEKRQWTLQRPCIESVVGYNDFLNLLCHMVPSHIPTGYLEGYQQLVTLVDKLPWPTRPKAIFSTNVYSSSVFNAWAANKVEKDVPFVVGQHGGLYGMGKWKEFYEEHETAIADRFISWGWKDVTNPKVEPIGNLKGFLQKKISRTPEVALLVQMTLPRFSFSAATLPVAAGQWNSYFEDQCRFLGALPVHLQEHVLIRLFPEDYGHQQQKRWRRRFPKINLNDGKGPMSESLKKTRLFVSTYNATTYLESLSLNIPTIIFWNPGHWELREEVRCYFEILKTVGIFHESPEGAALQMTSIWDDVPGWWESEVLQLARQKFCEQFAYIPGDPVKNMKKLFKNVSDTSTDVTGGYKYPNE